MAKLTFNFELSRNVTKSGVSHILLRIQDDQKSKKRINTGIDVVPSNWNPKRQRVRVSDEDYAIKNAKLQEILDNAEDAKIQLISANAKVNSESVSSVYKKEDTPLSFLQFSKEYAQRLFDIGELREHKKYMTAIQKLQFFVNNVSYQAYLASPDAESDQYPDYERTTFKKGLDFSDITNGFVQKYIAYLKGMPNRVTPSKVISPGTVKKQISLFRSCYYKGIKEKDIQYKTNPFYGLRLPAMPKPKAKLTLDEIDRLNDVQLESHSKLEIARDCFMYSFYCAGMRCGDLLCLRGTNLYKEDGEWRMKYQMEKTSKLKDIKLQLQALAILTRYVDFNNLTSDYIFPLLPNDAPYAYATTNEAIKILPPELKRLRIKDLESKNSVLNRYLSILTGMAHIDKHVSMHVSRHSFADVARTKVSNMYDIREAMGHSDIATTQGYFSRTDTAAQDRVLDMVYRTESKEEKLIEQLITFPLPTLNRLLLSKGLKLVTVE